MPLCRWHFQVHFLEWKCIDINQYFTEFYSQGSNQQYSSIGPDNGLVPTRQQTIMWTNDHHSTSVFDYIDVFVFLWQCYSPEEFLWTSHDYWEYSLCIYNILLTGLLIKPLCVMGLLLTLLQVMACCLTATNHYLNQCWVINTTENEIFRLSFTWCKEQSPTFFWCYIQQLGYSF